MGAEVNHLAQGWRQARTGSSGARFQHFWLPEDSDEAHRALVHLTRTARRATATGASYDHARLHDLVANEGFSHHPLHGSAPSHGFMASYDAPEGSGQAVVHHISTIAPDHIAAHRAAIAHHLEKPGSYQGGWHDTADGSVYLDASRHFNDEHEVRQFAGAEKQKAYFHLGDFTERFMNPKQDPLALKDHTAWKERYSGVGTEPHPAFHDYAHRYPDTPEQTEHWSQHTGKGRMAGRPVGPFRSENYIREHLGER
jgi:hypothetical protein